MGLVPEGVRYMERSLSKGAMANLEELNLSGNTSLQGEGVQRLLKALTSGEGACPRLRRLHLGRTCGPFSIPIGHAVADALESGHLHHLQDLNLFGHELGQGGMAAIARALQGGACPQLMGLHLTEHELGAVDGQALGEAMRAGGCAKLEELELHFYRMNNEGFVAILRELAGGRCPNLKRLDLAMCPMGLPAATVLGHALESVSWPHLHFLSLQWTFSREPAATLHVVRGIHDGGRGALPNLLHLNLNNTAMGQEHGQLLGQAIGIGAIPKLEMLDIAWNPAMGNDGVGAIMGGIEGGGCPHLKELLMFKVNMSPQGGQVVARVLASGKLSCLQTLSVSRNEALGEGGTIAIVAALEGGGCPHLKELNMAEVGMGPQGAQALVRALTSGKLSYLQTLYLGSNHGIGDGAMREVMMGLKQCHHLREMLVPNTDMDWRAGGALVQALLEGAWPRLVWMDVSHNDFLFMGEDLRNGLAEAIGGGKLPFLEKFDLKTTGVADEVLGGVLRAMGKPSGPCPRLREVNHGA